MRKLNYFAAGSVLALCAGQPAIAQQSSFTYQRGRDTVAIEQFTRTKDRVTGELVSRQGANVTRLQYEAVLDRNGRATSAVFRSRSAGGTPIPNQPTEVRLTFIGDSVKREAVFADSTAVRTASAVRGTPLQGLANGLFEIPLTQMRKSKAQTFTIAAVNSGG